MSQDAEDTRNDFADLLRLISDKQAQLDYEREVPIADVPAELICLWFDDHYHPDTTWFKESFSDSERALLADFSSFYESRLDTMPRKMHCVADLHALPEWDEVVTKAAQTLRALRWTP